MAVLNSGSASEALARISGAEAEWPARFLTILEIADPNPKRTALRSAIVGLAGNEPEAANNRLKELAQSWDIAAHPAQTTETLCVALVQSEAKQAVLMLESLVAKNPRLLEVHNDLGFAYMQLDPPDRTAALAHWQAVVVLAPESPGAHYNLAHLMNELERYEEARLEYQKAIELKPDYAAAYFNLGELLTRRGQSQEAKPFLEKAARIDPSDVKAQRVLGGVYRRNGRRKEAEDLFRSAIETQPDYAAALGKGRARSL